jgi:hypothetical protein
LAKSRLTFQKRQKELARIRKREEKKKRLTDQRTEAAESEGDAQLVTQEDLIGLGLAEPEPEPVPEPDKGEETTTTTND